MMLFRELAIQGVFLIEPERREDERGFFARTFCTSELAGRCLVDQFRQSSISYSARRGTVRGMHFSRAPHEETKIVRCTAGAIFDVVVDLRAGSPTELKWLGVPLSAQNRHALYIPCGFAHGFQSLQDATEVLYMIDKDYVPAAAAGVRWNDPAIQVQWPEPISVISQRDLIFQDWGS
jgi:dTDP-4-dehydrorhamnose 3,5-epimerase